MAKVYSYIGTTITWFVGRAAYVGRFMMHCALMPLFSAPPHWRGGQMAQGIRHFTICLVGARGDAAVPLVAQAIRVVVLSVVVTALIQAVFGGTDLVVFDVPYTVLLTALMILSCLIQLDSLPALTSTTIWPYWTGDTA